MGFGADCQPESMGCRPVYRRQWRTDWVWPVVLAFGPAPSQRLTPFLLLVPVFAVAVSQVLLQEGVSLSLVVGGVAVLAGVALCQVRLPARQVRAGDAPVE